MSTDGPSASEPLASAGTALDPIAIPALSDEVVAALAVAGIGTLEALASADAAALASAGVLEHGLLVHLVEAAVGALHAAGAPAVEPGSRPSEPLLRGLRVARAIEHTVGLVRKARSRLGKDAAAHLAWPNRRSRRQLKKLRRVLEFTQQQVLSSGLAEDRAEALTLHLAALDQRVEELLAASVDKSHLREVRRVARTARKAMP